MRKILLILLFQLLFSSSLAEILVFKNCTNEDYSFEKNEYKLDVENGIMTRDFIYSDETYERLRLNDKKHVLLIIFYWISEEKSLFFVGEKNSRYRHSLSRCYKPSGR